MKLDDIKQRALAEAAEMFTDALLAEGGIIDGNTKLCMAKAIAAYETALWCSDMDAAPRDGTRILAELHSGEVQDVMWFQGDWVLSHARSQADGYPKRFNLKRWRPLPTLPENI